MKELRYWNQLLFPQENLHLEKSISGCCAMNLQKQIKSHKIYLVQFHHKCLYIPYQPQCIISVKDYTQMYATSPIPSSNDLKNKFTHF